eukprot:1159843-Pelagomonas_calceolata.AAC.9
MKTFAGQKGVCIGKGEERFLSRQARKGAHSLSCSDAVFAVQPGSAGPGKKDACLPCMTRSFAAHETMTCSICCSQDHAHETMTSFVCCA